MKPGEKPKPEPIVIDNIPLKEFEQFESGARFSIQFTTRTPPYYKQEVVLICEPKAAQAYRKKEIKTTVLNSISLDTFLSSKNYYDTTLDLKKKKRDGKTG